MSVNFSFLPGDHPFLDSVWIWPQSYMYLYNHYANFRYDFELEDTPKKAPFFITADKAYRLYINGNYVGRGPARGYQGSWPYDEIDVSSYLKIGQNWIAVEAYNPGISTFQYLHKTRAGMICAARWGDFKINTSPDTWMMRRSPARNSNTARYSMQLDFQEDFDASVDDRSWIFAPQPPRGWEADLLPEMAQHSLSTPLGQYPFEGMEPRGIPMLHENLFVPAGLTSVGRGKCSGDYSSCQNISWQFAKNELATVKKWDNADCVNWGRNGGWMEIEIPATLKGELSVITVDLGEYTVSSLEICAEGASGDEIIDIHYFQCLRKGIPEFVDLGSGCMVALANRMRPAVGTSSHEFFHFLGGRHISLVIRDARKSFKVKLRGRTALYPFSMKGKFKCSDELLNDIHDMCRRTQQICSIDAYVDTPWREQAQWWGDARVQAKNTFYLDGDTRLFVRGIRSIAMQSTSSGLTFGHAPTCAGNCILPDFSLTWILTIWDYYYQTGDISIFVEQHDRVKEILAYFENKDVRDNAGMLIYDSRYWLFEDWSSLPKEGVPTFLNLWYVITLEKYADMLEISGLAKEADMRRHEIEERKHLLVEKLFDRDLQLFWPFINDKEELAGAPSVHDQVLAMMLGLASEAHQNMIEKILMPYLKDEKIEGAVPSAFWATYLFSLMEERGFGKEVIEFIRTKWAPMLSTGTTWEGYDWEEKSGWSAAHAWTAHPSYHLVNIINGIHQKAVAWKEIEWSPVFIDGMTKAEACVPAPQGMIKSSWYRRADKSIKASIEIPDNTIVNVKLPGKSDTVAKAGAYTYDVEL